MRTIGYSNYILDRSTHFQRGEFLLAMRQRNRATKILIGLAFSLCLPSTVQGEPIQSEQDYINFQSSNCLIKSPEYNAECTRIALSMGTDSVNIHFLNNEKRVVTFIIDKTEFRMNKSSNGLSSISKFFAIWHANGTLDRIIGSCTESEREVECNAKNMTYTASIWN